MISPELTCVHRRAKSAEEQARHDRQHQFIISGLTLKWLQTCTTYFQPDQPKRKHRKVRDGSHKLTADDVREIRCETANGERRKVLARKFGVDASTIYDILVGRTWKGVT